jgi:hypothetical protein
MVCDIRQRQCENQGLLPAPVGKLASSRAPSRRSHDRRRHCVAGHGRVQVPRYRIPSVRPESRGNPVFSVAKYHASDPFRGKKRRIRPHTSAGHMLGQVLGPDNVQVVAKLGTVIAVHVSDGGDLIVYAT